MIKNFFLLFIGLMLPIIVHSKNSCPGIYSTVEDYKRNCISIIADTTHCKTVKIDDFFFRPYLCIRTATGKQKVLKKEIFAVKMLDGSVYRIVNDACYRLLDTSNICIYSKEKRISIVKRSVYSPRYEYKKVTDYFFSITLSDSIQALNLTNIRLALLKDKQMDNKLVEYFKDDKSLFTTTKNGQFLINEFLNSIKY